MDINACTITKAILNRAAPLDAWKLALIGLAHHGYCVAVDFDGTLCENKYPLIGEASPVVEQVKLAREAGIEVILWTCRDGERLNEALAWCAENGLTFDAVNENTPTLKAKWGNDPRKVGANEYWDDKAVRI